MARQPCHQIDPWGFPAQAVKEGRIGPIVRDNNHRLARPNQSQVAGQPAQLVFVVVAVSAPVPIDGHQVEAPDVH